MLTVLRLLREAGHNCTELALSNEDDGGIAPKIKESDAVILPLPCEKGGKLNSPMWHRQTDIGDIFSAGTENTLFIGGAMPCTGDNFIDYSLREDFLLQNAHLTAEGALALALNNTDISLRGAKTIIMGYGRIGQFLAQMLKALNSRVTIVARREESRVLAKTQGMDAVGFRHLAEKLNSAEVVFNTIPFPVIGEAELSAASANALFIELASLPGGIDAFAAEHQGKKLIKAPGLPGKTAPETAGRIIFETVCRILEERGFAI